MNYRQKKFNRIIAKEHADMLAEGGCDTILTIGINRKTKLYHYVHPTDLNPDDIEGLLEEVFDSVRISNETRKSQLN